jgi:anti-anti-sigma regulatory factor
MLRITAKREGERTKILYLEGKICQEWVKELRSEIDKGIHEGRKVILDFSKVSFIDEEAASMIKMFPLHKVERKNGSLFIRTMLCIEDKETG